MNDTPEVKPSRNEPCSCGSGTKYKRCCYAKDRAGKQPPPFSAQLPLHAFGLAGEEHSIVVAPVFANGVGPNPGGTPGEYSVTFVLRRPDATLGPPTTFDFDVTKHIGNSYFGISPPAVRFEDDRHNASVVTAKFTVTAGTRIVEAFGHPNAEGYLSDISLTLTAASFVEATHNAQMIITPMLSAVATKSDVPILVAYIVAKETATQVAHRTMFAPFPFVAGVGEIPLAHPPELRTLMNAYRDGISSTDSNWRFLCFSKVVEQLWKWQGARTKKGEALNFDLDAIRIPTDQADVESWIKDIFPTHFIFDAAAIDDVVPEEARGLTTNEVIKTFLRPIRHDIAHGLFKGGLLNDTESDVLLASKVRRWLPMLRCIARVHLRATFGFP